MICYLNLPPIPAPLVDSVVLDIDRYHVKAQYGNYNWSDSFNDQINNWCKTNISDTVYWAFQFMTGDVPTHKDKDTVTKLVYILNPGGSSVTTNFFDSEHGDVVKSYVIQPCRWHLLQANQWHSVEHIEPGQVRFSVTGRIFP